MEGFQFGSGVTPILATTTTGTAAPIPIVAGTSTTSQAPTGTGFFGGTAAATPFKLGFGAPSTTANVAAVPGVSAVAPQIATGFTGLTPFQLGSGVTPIPATTTTAAPIPIVAGTSATSQTTAGTGFLGGTATAAATPFKLGFAAPSTAANVAAVPGVSAVPPQTSGLGGLGGVQPAVSNDPTQVLATGGGTVGGTVTRPEERTLKDAPLPIELIQLVEELNSHIKSEKQSICELASTVGRSIEKVSERCNSIGQQLSTTSSLIHRQILDCEALLAQLNKDAKDAEMARIVRDTPAAVQHDQKTPYVYLFNTIASFHDKIILYKREILKAETVLKSTEGSKAFTPVDLSLALHSTKDSLILLAAKVKTLHEKVLAEVDSHRNLLRFVTGNNIGKEMLADRAKSLPPQRPTGPTGPPMGLGNDKTIAYLSKSNALFTPKYTKPANKTYAEFMDNTAKTMPMPTQRIFHSTQVLPTQMDNATFNTSGFGQPLFQSTTNPIFTQDITSPVPTTSLKRSKQNIIN